MTLTALYVLAAAAAGTYALDGAPWAYLYVPVALILGALAAIEWHAVQACRTGDDTDA